MADQPSPRRRFQFRLRTLLIGVTLLAMPCAYVASQDRIVSERTAVLCWIREHKGSSTTGEPDSPRSTTKQQQPAAVSWVRRLLGDHQINHIELPPDTDIGEVRRIRTMFPESDVYAYRWDGSRQRFMISDFPD
jgi:hypothetical protein